MLKDLLLGIVDINHSLYLIHFVQTQKLSLSNFMEVRRRRRGEMQLALR